MLIFPIEHMLFLGTEKYPDDNSYAAFINQAGGLSNAYTAHEDTNFYFDVTSDHFNEALDRYLNLNYHYKSSLFSSGSLSSF